MTTENDKQRIERLEAHLSVVERNIELIHTRLKAIAPEHKPKKKKVWINVWYDGGWHVAEYATKELATSYIIKEGKYYVVGMEAEVPEER